MKRTKISKESLESIGFEPKTSWWMFVIKKDLSVSIELINGKYMASIENDKSSTFLDREFEFIDEITTLLTGLTGKTSFHK